MDSGTELIAVHVSQNVVRYSTTGINNTASKQGQFPTIFPSFAFFSRTLFVSFCFWLSVFVPIWNLNLFTVTHVHPLGGTESLFTAVHSFSGSIR